MPQQTCGTRYEKSMGNYALCQRYAGHEVHGEKPLDESLALLRGLVIAWDSDRAAEFIPAIQESRKFLGLKLTDEKAKAEAADFGDLNRLDDAAHNEQMMHLANAMKKVIPPELMKQLIDHLDPLTPFLEFLQSQETS